MVEKRTGELPKISFSTLACPEWTPTEIISRAAELGYDAIEWRGGPEGHVSPKWSHRERTELRSAVERAGLASLAVTAYTELVSSDPRMQRDNVADLERHLQLAADLGASNVRVFLGNPDDAASRPTLERRAIEALRMALPTARGVKVAIAVEAHDAFKTSASLVPVLKALDDPWAGAVWDIVNSWEAGEDPSAGAESIARWIRFVQVKDGVREGRGIRLTAIGDGDVPLRAGFQALARQRPLPPVSVEWERPWHPHLAPASEALGPALASVRELLQSLGPAGR